MDYNQSTLKVADILNLKEYEFHFKYRVQQNIINKM